MIITVTPNTALDVTYEVDELRPYQSHRVKAVHHRAGGKGINVASVLTLMGHEVVAMGLTGGTTGAQIQADLEMRGVGHCLIDCDGDSRRTINVVSARHGDATIFNEPGPQVSSAHWRELMENLVALVDATATTVVVLSGSLPRGVEPGLYGRLIEEMKRLGVLTVLDSEGEPMNIATRKGPDIVTPNELEAEGLVGHEFSDEEDRRTAIGEMVELGAREAIMTLADGCLAMLVEGGERRLFRATLEPLEPVSSVGSGDAFLAGFVAARYGERDIDDCLRFAVACGAESTQHFGAGRVEQREVERLVPDVRVEQLETPALTVG